MLERLPHCMALTLLAAVLLLPAAEANSADDKGQHAVRGAGLINCALYTQEREAKGDVYLVTAAWIDGYVTGINQHAPETYDLLSFEGTELLTAIIAQHCRDNPTDPVFGVLTKLFEQLEPDRLTEKSDKVVISLAGKEVSHYVELIMRLQRKLKSRGLYDGEIHGDYSPETADAVRRFQESIDFEATGFPDQLTLWTLMRASEEDEQ